MIGRNALSPIIVHAAGKFPFSINFENLLLLFQELLPAQKLQMVF
jgi:hypothetical protein